MRALSIGLKDRDGENGGAKIQPRRMANPTKGADKPNLGVLKCNLGVWRIQPGASEDASGARSGSKDRQVKEVGGVTMESNRPSMKSLLSYCEISSGLL